MWREGEGATHLVLTGEQDTGSRGSHEHHGPTSSFTVGLAILFLAQVLSSIMGLYTEETYRTYGPQWKENLFYSHLLSLPLFLPFFPSLVKQLLKLANSPPVALHRAALVVPHVRLSDGMQRSLARVHIPSQLFYLVLNVLTQYGCIRGVNLLAAMSSALTVTIVLNIRKLLSLLLSIWLFGNRLAAGTLLGAGIVFFAGALYSLDGRRNPQARSRTPGAAKAG